MNGILTKCQQYAQALENEFSKKNAIIAKLEENIKRKQQLNEEEENSVIPNLLVPMTQQKN